MKITVDSSEPLQDALRVLGAMYGVTLVVSSDDHDEPATTKARRTGARRPEPARTPKASARRSKLKAGSQSPVAASSADVRTWARHHGFSVSDRGRLPASVVAAYRSAHNL